ncbi:MAG TPA: helix-turn-helix domain-containing protein [Myxococcota bacterium]|nr:helix-turn-helix domain-containing protein [Myxococcota bacterium]
MGRIHVVTLTSKQRRELQRLVARPAETAAVARRAHVVLWSADGISGAEIARRLHLSVEAVSRIRRRFLEGGVAGGPRDAARSRRTGGDRRARGRASDVAAAGGAQPLNDPTPGQGGRADERLRVGAVATQ